MIIALTVLFILFDIYIFRSLKVFSDAKWLKAAYLITNALLYAAMIYFALHIDKREIHPYNMQFLAIVFVAFILPKALIVIFNVMDDVLRVGQYSYQRVAGQDAHWHSRRKALAYIGWGSAALLSGIMLDGVLFGKYRHRVRRVNLKYPALPAAFNGYKVIQLSDVHSGSFTDAGRLEHIVKLVNDEQPDLILFTGDMVNSYAEEFELLQPLFARLHAKDGKYSVLGNHDYGHYGVFDSAAAAAANVPKLIAMQKKAGFTMLRNEHFSVQRGQDKIYIIGVENWGLKPFPQYGDLDKAAAGVPATAFKILMSHDPSHFDAVVKHHPANVQLTLSGHTHGMQFGLDLKNIKWSPVQYKYPKWADLYESEGKNLYVNRGFGVLAYPGRVGIWPEITLFTLRNA